MTKSHYLTARCLAGCETWLHPPQWSSRRTAVIEEAHIQASELRRMARDIRTPTQTPAGLPAPRVIRISSATGSTPQ